MRGSAASHTDKNLRRFVPTINCRGNKQIGFYLENIPVYFINYNGHIYIAVIRGRSSCL
jgi:hypothetical protein